MAIDREWIREIIAGVTTFLTLAYALVLIPTLLGQHDMDVGAVMTATILTGVYATSMMGLLARYPFVAAPGVAMGVYISYGLMDVWQLTWEVAMGVIFLTGCSLVLLNVLHIRVLILETVPQCLRVATTAGLGLFLVIIGLKHGGILLELAYPFPIVVAWTFAHSMVVVGIVVTAVLWWRNFPGALFVGMLVVWGIAAYTGHVEWQGVMTWPQRLDATFLHLDVRAAVHFLGAWVSLLFVALFDATGSVLALTQKLGCIEERREKCHVPRLKRLFMCDSTGSLLSGILGTTPVAIYVESMAGINAGGRRGLTACVAAVCMVSLLFFSPLAASMPLYATAAALILIGVSMLRQLQYLQWRHPIQWISGCATLIWIPLTFNIARGIGVGYLVYCALQLLTGQARRVHPFSWVMALLFLIWFLCFN